MRRILLVMMLVTLSDVMTGCATIRGWGKQVDDRVVAGKLTAEGAALLNQDTEEHHWKRHDDFGRPLEADERIVAHELSECLRAATQGGDRPEACFDLLSQ